MDFFKTLGCYPPGYNPKVHGTYIPHRYYGPKDTPLFDVKLGDLKDWIMRREKTPRAVTNVASRMRHLWFYKWSKPKNANAAVWIQFCCITTLLYYCSSFEYQRKF